MADFVWYDEAHIYDTPEQRTAILKWWTFRRNKVQDAIQTLIKQLSEK